MQYKTGIVDAPTASVCIAVTAGEDRHPGRLLDQPSGLTAIRLRSCARQA
jgi:hypothetical protein